ncbi:MAG: TIGR04282 family arsenosugar biosynthesis glycosyltransferase [Planctomycetes bacterium]|nr:TIGR04282 family arsenosugar biosynthesis glycosyltransferase [Planctomycetota bacterium]
MQAETSSSALIVIAKAPLRGFAKTRLVGERGLDADAVARLADAFVRDTLRACARVSGVRRVVCFAPREAEAYFRELAPDALLVPQGEGDLGARLSGAFDAVFASGATRAVLIGMDTPHVEPKLLERAFRELEHADCVLGPASDGGYYLIALRERRPEVFRRIEWSTPRALAQTLERAREAGLATVLIDEVFDVDGGADLARLEALLGADGEPCPRTARVLADVRAASNGGAGRADGARSP